MRTALNNLNADLVQQYPDYVCRVTADEGDIGRGHMQRFQDVETRSRSSSPPRNCSPPASTRPPAATSYSCACQLDGRVQADHRARHARRTTTASSGSTSSTTPARPHVISPTRPSTAIPPSPHRRKLTNTENKSTEVETPEQPEDEGGEIKEPPAAPSLLTATQRVAKILLRRRPVEIAAELVHELDSDGKQLRVVKLTDYTAEKVRTLCASPDELRARWADAGQRADIVQQLAERGIDFQQVAVQAGKPDADPSTCCAIWPSTHRAHPPPARRPREKATSRFLQLFCPGSPRNPE